MIRSNSIKTVRVSNGKPMAMSRKPFYGYSRPTAALRGAATALLYVLAVIGALSVIGMCAYYADYYNIFGSLK